MLLDQRSHCLRKARLSEPGGFYLLTVVTHERDKVFADWRIGRLLVTELRAAEQHAQSVAWVVMPDHLHWLVALREGTLAELMCRVKSRSSLRVNQALGGRGRLWQRGYHDRALRREDNIREVARYVIANPLRAGLVARVGDYPLWDAMWL
ncbi:hypothetical protein PMM47T1_11542 [Pseudomonas sp. M47T1]|uniref:REP-associated tyrosine transposase n=1 Tax=Pseudomonas sp. M47T1 TaxID=1179778 RepID=UPI0002608809|nr:transposase [Pseudomonas sp. M47T1]EIK96558.1 hypothetical protein PMM47T1_11542 [Pseudomonas sp. M47T1]